MIPEHDTARIAGDAYIIMDTAGAIITAVTCNGTLHPDYLKEKLDIIKDCVQFMENFTND